jgi:hypothetical protein
MRHGNMERHMVTRRDPGMETCLFSSLLVVGSGLVISPYRCGLNPPVSCCLFHSASFNLGRARPEVRGICYGVSDVRGIWSASRPSFRLSNEINLYSFVISDFQSRVSDSYSTADCHKGFVK